MLRLKDVRTLVTGGADGLGLAIAKAFIREGANVFLLDISAEKLAAATVELRSQNLQAHAIQGSVADPKDVEATFEQMDRLVGGVDALINNAGVSSNHPTLELTDALWDTALAVNLKGSFLCARAAGRRMVAQRAGSIVNISSIFGVTAAPERLAYCVSKAGVAMMAKALAVEWAEYGVRCNAIAPGYVHTKLIDDLAARGRINLSAIEKRTPLGRFADAADIAEMAVYLCSASAAYITGQVIGVDGGWTAYGYI